MDSDNQKINKIALLGTEAKCLIETFKQFQYTSERHGALKPFLGVSNGYIPFVNMMLIQDFSVIAFEICNFSLKMIIHLSQQLLKNTANYIMMHWPQSDIVYTFILNMDHIRLKPVAYFRD